MKDTSHDISNINFRDLFDLEKIQKLQDLFSAANGVASIICEPDGTPLTKPSNFTRLCGHLVRKTEKGRTLCKFSDLKLGQINDYGPTMQPCYCIGLWDAGANIKVGGKHIANWLIGQIRNEDLNKDQLIKEAEKLNIDKNEFIKAYLEVPSMSTQKFATIAKMLYAFANELSENAFNIVLLKQQIAKKKKATKLLKANKKARLESEEKYRTLFENVHDVFYRTDLDGNILEISPSIKHFADFDRTALLNTPLSQLYFDPEDRTTLLAKIRKENEVIDYEIKIKDKYGAPKYASINARIIYDENGTPMHMDGAIRDITDRKHSETKLKEIAERQSSILQTAMDGFWLCDLEGRLLEVNDTYSTMSQFSCEELLTMKISDLEAHESPNDTLKHIQILQEKSEDRFETKHRKKDGSIFEVEISAQYKSMDGGRLVVFIHDITNRKKAEKELSYKMRQLTRFQKLTIGRELAMIELKKEVNQLLQNLGKDSKYKIVE